jgi:hypothetical protein
MFDKKQMKIDLAQAAARGINQYLETKRGGAVFGPNARFAGIDDTSFHVVMPDNANGPIYFEVKVKESV